MAVGCDNFVSVLFLVLVFSLASGDSSICRPRGCTGTVFKGKESGLSLGSFSKGRCGGDCEIWHRCRGTVTCQISKMTEVTWKQMLGWDTMPLENKEYFDWSSRSPKEVALIARWNLFNEKIIKLKAIPVGGCSCRCRRKYLGMCTPKMQVRAMESNVVRALISETLHEDPNQRRIRRLKTYNNL